MYAYLIVAKFHGVKGNHIWLGAVGESVEDIRSRWDESLDNFVAGEEPKPVAILKVNSAAGASQIPVTRLPWKAKEQKVKR